MADERGVEVATTVSEGVEPVVEAKRPNAARRAYNWVIGWSDTPHGEVALGGLSFAEASFFPIPPDPLLMALAVGQPRRALRFAAVCSLASVLGGVFGYLIGAFLWEQTQGFFYSVVPGFSPEKFEHVRGLYEQYGVGIVFVAGFTPIPYKIFTICSGVFGLNVLGFMLASAVGRSARFFLVAGLIYKFGPQIREKIEKHFDLFAVLFVILLVGGFAAIKLLH